MSHRIAIAEYIYIERKNHHNKWIVFHGRRSLTMKHTFTMSSLKSSPSIFSTFKDITALYSPVDEDGTDGSRPKPGHHPVQFQSCHGPDDSLLR